MIKKGFTLIELMIVVAIIGILAAIAIPMYGDYIKRTYIAETLTATKGLRMEMEEYYIANGVYPSGSAIVTPLSALAGSFDYVDEIKISANTTRLIQIKFNDKIYRGSCWFNISVEFSDAHIRWVRAAQDSCPNNFGPPAFRR